MHEQEDVFDSECLFGEPRIGLLLVVYLVVLLVYFGDREIFDFCELEEVVLEVLRFRGGFWLPRVL